MERGRIPEAILFDVDGTLIDSYRLYLEAYRRSLGSYLGYAPSDEEIAARRPTSERRFIEEWIGAERAEECHADLRRQYAELHASHCEGMYDGVREMLAALRNAGMRQGIVTGKGRSAWEVTTGSIALGDFEVVVTDDDVAEPKPDPGGLLAAAEALGIEPRGIAYVGDSISDLDAGRRAGMITAAALWPKTGEGERERFLSGIQPHAPDWTFERPADLVRAFAPWC